jgi:hypothetical protein
MPAEVVDPQGPVDQSSADTEVLPACFAEQAGVFHSEGMMTNLNFKCLASISSEAHSRVEEAVGMIAST